MIETFYALVIVIFGCLSALALFTHMIKGGELREANRENREQCDRLDESIADVRHQIQDLEFNTGLLEEERLALEAQAQSMLELEDDRKRQIENEEVT